MKGGAKRDACTALHGSLNDIPELDLKMVPEVQGGMLAPPFMDHRMTSELDFIGKTNCRTHDFSHRTPRTLDTLCGGSQMPGAPKRTLSA